MRQEVEIEGEFYMAGERVSPGIYKHVDSPYTLTLDGEDTLPARLDGRATCFNLAKTHNSRQSRLTPGLDENRVGEAQGADPLETTLSGEEMHQVHAALAELAPLLRMAVTLCVLEGLSFRELAEALGVPLQTAASRVQRALTQVREQLEEVPSEMRRC